MILLENFFKRRNCLFKIQFLPANMFFLKKKKKWCVEDTTFYSFELLGNSHRFLFLCGYSRFGNIFFTIVFYKLFLKSIVQWSKPQYQSPLVAAKPLSFNEKIDAMCLYVLGDFHSLAFISKDWSMDRIGEQSILSVQLIFSFFLLFLWTFQSWSNQLFVIMRKF